MVDDDYISEKAEKMDGLGNQHLNLLMNDIQRDTTPGGRAPGVRRKAVSA